MTTMTATKPGALTDGTRTIYRARVTHGRNAVVRIEGARLRLLARYGDDRSWWIADGAPQPIEIIRAGADPETFTVEDLDVAGVADRRVIDRLVDSADRDSRWTFEDCDRDFKWAAERRDRLARTPEGMSVVHDAPLRTYAETITGKVALVKAPEFAVERIGRCEPLSVIYQFGRSAPDTKWRGTITIMAKRESSALPDAFGPGSVIDPPQWLIDALASIVPAEGLANGDPMRCPPDRVSPPFQEKPARRTRRR